MSIVKMRRMKVVAADDERKKLFRSLVRLGCVEITPPDQLLAEEELNQLVQQGHGDPEVEDRLRNLKVGMQTLKDIAHPKKSMFAPRQQISEDSFLEASELTHAEEIATEVREKAERIRQLEGNIAVLDSKSAQFKPWSTLEIPLNWKGTRHTVSLLGSLPPQTKMDSLLEKLEREAPESELTQISADAEQIRFFMVMHESVEETAMQILKEAGFSRVTFEETETPKQIIENLQQKRIVCEEEKKQLTDEICSYKEEMPLLEKAWDMLTQKQSDSAEEEKLLHTKKAVYFEGWTPAKDEERVTALLNEYGCAYEFSDPEEGDDVPIKLQNSKIVEPLNVVTEMYSLPSYDGIDPNPLIFPFFTLFFGIMYADIGYGLILTLIGSLVTWKMKPKGTMGYMMKLVILCGITTTFAGACFGGFFGDVVTVLSRYFGHEVTLPALAFNPMEEPMTMLIVSLVLGAIHILVGMAVKAYMSIRDGHPLDALFDVGSWWLLFAGIALLALGITPYVAIAGVVALILTQGRNSPTIVGKFIGGIASLYDITSYLSDILSYLRLMALVLATSVIASVVNTLGIMTGLIGFVVIFLIGHAFNMGVNIIGTYVHAARLQYLEFFGKFYKEGGRPFAPYQIQTKYVDVIKEEKVS